MLNRSSWANSDGLLKQLADVKSRFIPILFIMTRLTKASLSVSRFDLFDDGKQTSIFDD